GGNVTINTGSTLNYGGGMFGINFNNGASLKNGGFINYHLSVQRQASINRQDPIDVDAEISSWTNQSGPNAASDAAQVRKFLSAYPDGFNKNGTPDNTSAKFLINTEIPLTDNTTFYANAAYVFRKSRSYANYRQPYWRLDRGLLHKPDPFGIDYTTSAANYDTSVPNFLTEVTAEKAAGVYKGYLGYQPTFEGDLNDYNGTVGLRTKNSNGWNTDMSLTVGGNKMLFTVDQTVNRSLGRNSPISFKPGGFNFNHMVGNIDVSKNITEKLFIGLGVEARSENWQLIAGDTASYSGQGANSFFGYLPDNAINANRLIVGAYFDLSYDITDNWMVGGTYRAEHYTDFGDANVYKLLSRFKIGEVVTLRASYSTGFRAPTL
ncbi:MAG: TonB-dependent receptor domain-containing protein, partial [Cytophagales bacterium]